MKSLKYLFLLSGLLIVAFVIFVIGYENYTRQQHQAGVDVHAQVVANSVWTLFTPVTEQYLSLSVRNNDYQQLRIISLGNTELFSYQKKLEGFENKLLEFGLIRIDKFNAPVIYKERKIGQLNVHAHNKNIYTYFYVAILLFLSTLLLWFIRVLFWDRKTLKERVAAKTAQIAASNRQLQESEQTFLTLFDQSFQFIALLTPDGRVCKMNKTALDFHQLTETDVLGDFYWVTPWWNHSEKLINQFKKALTLARSGKVARFEAHSTTRQEIYLDVSLKPVFNNSGETIYIVAEARDVTDVRHAEEELQQAQKMESVGTLAGGIAHDFNNILAGILGTLTLLKLKRDKGQPLSEDVIFQHLDTVTETTLRARDIVNQLLTLSRKYDLKFTPCDLQKILQLVVLVARNSFDKAIQIDTQIDQEFPVFADANSLEQVFLNICINAAHAMTIMRNQGEAWGGTLTITVNQLFVEEKLNCPAGDYWNVSIRDTGVGMEREILDRIFIPFFTTKSKESGSGLGLSMVYSIINQHKGFIEVQSESKVGTQFDIFLPVCHDHIIKNQVELKREELETGEGLILIIDDEQLIRDNASEILRECGYEVISAENGIIGLDLYRKHQHRIKAILLDLVMPVLSGQETFAALKSINQEVKVLLSSGYRHDERVDLILAAGATGFIQKPYSLYTLAKEIKKIL